MLRKIISFFKNPLKMSGSTPFSISQDGKWLFFGNQRIERRGDVPAEFRNRIPDLNKQLQRMVMDQTTIDTVFKTLAHWRCNSNPVLEGETSASKTAGVIFAAALLGLPVFRLNHSGTTSVSDILGRYVPNSAKAQSQLFFIMHNKDISAYREETQQLISKYRYEKNGEIFMRQISEHDMLKIAEFENIHLSERPFTFALGPLPESEQCGGLYLADELNLAPSDIQSVYNAPLESDRTTRVPGLGLTMSVNGEGNEKVHPYFRFAGTQNPVTYGTRNKQSPDLKRRIITEYVQTPSIKEINDMIMFMVYGVNPEVTFNGKSYKADSVKPYLPQLAKKENVPFFGLLSNFHHKLQEACASQIMNRNRKQKLVFTRRDIIAFLKFLSEFKSYSRSENKDYTFENNSVETFLRAIDLFYTSRFILDEDDREFVVQLKLDTFGVIDKEFLLSNDKAFGENFSVISELFVNPYNNNLIVKENALELLQGMSFSGRELKANLKAIIEKALKAELSPGEGAAAFLRDNHKARKLTSEMRPVIETSKDGKYLYIHDQKLEIRKDLTEEDKKLVPRIKKSGGLCLDQQTVRLLTNMAISAKYNYSGLIEGLPATTKTSGIVYLAGLLNQPIHRINFNGQTDPADLIGKFVPSDKTLAERYTEIFNAKNTLVMTEETKALLEKAALEQRPVSQTEAKEIAAREGLKIPDTNWVYLEEDLIEALRNDRWVVLDEVNQSETNVIERFNSLLEFVKTFLLSEHNGELLTDENGSIGPRVRIFGTFNPAEYPGKKVFSPAALNRWSVYLQINNVGSLELEQMLQYLIYGIQPEIELDGYRYSTETQEGSFKTASRLMKTEELLHQLAVFHHNLTEQVNPMMAKRTLAVDDQELLITRSELLEILKRIDKGELVDRVDTKVGVDVRVENITDSAEARKRIIAGAITEVYLSRFQGEDREKVKTLLDGAGLSEEYWQFDKMEIMISPEKAATKLNDAFIPRLTNIEQSMTLINRNPSISTVENEMNNARTIMDMLKEAENELKREMHKFQVTGDMVPEITKQIKVLKESFNSISESLNVAYEAVLKGERDAVANEVEDILSGIDFGFGQ